MTRGPHLVYHAFRGWRMAPARTDLGRGHPQTREVGEGLSMVQPRDPPASGAAPWLHLFLLVGLISLLEVARRMVSTEDILTYTLIARSVYAWMPALAGIAISVSGPHSKC